MNQTYVLTSIAMLEKTFELTMDERFNVAIAALKADAPAKSTGTGTTPSVTEKVSALEAAT